LNFLDRGPATRAHNNREALQLLFIRNLDASAVILLRTDDFTPVSGRLSSQDAALFDLGIQHISVRSIAYAFRFNAGIRSRRRKVG
jgi:hypothetical protein